MLMVLWRTVKERVVVVCGVGGALQGNWKALLTHEQRLERQRAILGHVPWNINRCEGPKAGGV